MFHGASVHLHVFVKPEIALFMCFMVHRCISMFSFHHFAKGSRLVTSSLAFLGQGYPFKMGFTLKVNMCSCRSICFGESISVMKGRRNENGKAASPESISGPGCSKLMM